MCTSHVFNWYIQGSCLYGDLCIRQGSQYEAYLKYKVDGVLPSGMKSKLQDNDRCFQFINANIRNVTMDEDCYITYLAGFGTVRLINMDVFFKSNDTRYANQINKLKTFMTN